MSIVCVLLLSGSFLQLSVDEKEVRTWQILWSDSVVYAVNRAKTQRKEKKTDKVNKSKQKAEPEIDSDLRFPVQAPLQLHHEQQSQM